MGIVRGRGRRRRKWLRSNVYRTLEEGVTLIIRNRNQPTILLKLKILLWNLSK